MTWQRPNPPAVTYREFRAVTLQALKLKDKLFRLGLIRSFNKMDAVTQQLGWEQADIIQGKQHTAVMRSRLRSLGIGRRLRGRRQP